MFASVPGIEKVKSKEILQDVSLREIKFHSPLRLEKGPSSKVINNLLSLAMLRVVKVRLKPDLLICNWASVVLPSWLMMWLALHQGKNSG